MHKKNQSTVPVGGSIVCGSRKLQIDAIDGDVIDITLTIKKGETVEVKDPKQRDNPWVLDDPGEGSMIESVNAVTVGHKIRVGNHRQFRILSVDGSSCEVMVVGPESEL